MRRPDESALVALGTIGAILAHDYSLLKRGKRPHTLMLRHNRYKWLVFVGVLGLHVADVLGPLDPFKILGKLTGVHPGRIVTEVTEELVDTMVPKV